MREVWHILSWVSSHSFSCLAILLTTEAKAKNRKRFIYLLLETVSEIRSPPQQKLLCLVFAKEILYSGCHQVYREVMFFWGWNCITYIYDKKVYFYSTLFAVAPKFPGKMKRENNKNYFVRKLIFLSPWNYITSHFFIKML